MKNAFVLLLAFFLAVGCAASGLAEPAVDAGIEGEGCSITDQGIDIFLWEDPNSGYAWSHEIDNPALLSLASDQGAQSGESGIHSWGFTAQNSGEALLTFYYELPWSDDPQAEIPETDLMASRTICFILIVENGKVVSYDMQDLSAGADSGDMDSVERFQGETGGVPLDVFQGMIQSETEQGVLLTASDGMTKILIRYEPQDDPEDLFEKLRDENAAGAIYNDPDAGVSVISCTLDREADIPFVTLVYTLAEGVEEYTGYKAPDGGVLHVHTTYLLFQEDAMPEWDPAADVPSEDLAGDW